MTDLFNQQSVWHGPTIDDFTNTSLTQEGDPYVYGYEVNLNDPNPPAFDCSELVQWAAAQHGIRIVDGAENQRDYLQNEGALIPVNEAIQTRGALLFSITPGPGGDHVAISLGNGQTSEARNSNQGVGVFNSEGRDWTHAGIIPGFHTDSVYPWEGPDQTVDCSTGHEHHNGNTNQQAPEIAPWENLPQSLDPNMDGTSAPEAAYQEAVETPGHGDHAMTEVLSDYGYEGEYSNGYTSADYNHPEASVFGTGLAVSDHYGNNVGDSASGNGYSSEGHSTTENTAHVSSPDHHAHSDSGAFTRDHVDDHTNHHLIDGASAVV